MHHSKLEEECRVEKSNLLRLLNKFRSTLTATISRYNIDNQEINSLQEFQSLESRFQDLSSSVIDLEYLKTNSDFKSIL
jgi:hypothetical protein